jgi:hypothetical protein
MNTHADKTLENKSQTVANRLPKLQSKSVSTFQLVDNRPEAIAQRKLQEAISNSPRVQQLKAYHEMAENSPQVSQLRAFQDRANNSPQFSKTAQLQSMADNYSAQQQRPIQKKKNKTGLPDNLKTGMENLSGMSLDDVNVHRNSDKPAQLQAHAYAQGTNIHLGPGQEKHLPHEAWHVVQQKQGRVQPTMQMMGKVNVNDNTGLEKEADVMGAKASKIFTIGHQNRNEQPADNIKVNNGITQLAVDNESSAKDVFESKPKPSTGRINAGIKNANNTKNITIKEIEDTRADLKRKGIERMNILNKTKVEADSSIVGKIDEKEKVVKVKEPPIQVEKGDTRCFTEVMEKEKMEDGSWEIQLNSKIYNWLNEDGTYKVGGGEEWKQVAEFLNKYTVKNDSVIKLVSESNYISENVKEGSIPSMTAVLDLQEGIALRTVQKANSINPFVRPKTHSQQSPKSETAIPNKKENFTIERQPQPGTPLSIALSAIINNDPGFINPRELDPEVVKAIMLGSTHGTIAFHMMKAWGLKSEDLTCTMGKAAVFKISKKSGEAPVESVKDDE